MRKTGLTKVAAAALAATMVLTACGGGNSTTATTAAAGGNTATTAAAGGSAETTAAAESSGNIGKTDIAFGMAADIVTMDPANQQDTTTSIFMKHVYSTLVEVDDDGNLIGDLATKWEVSEDGTSFTYWLNENATFADGTPVTAEDVKFTYDRAKEMPKTKSNTSKVQEVIVDNEHQVTIKLTQPYAPFKTIPANSNLSIVSKAAVEKAGEAYGDVDNVVGSGPFKVSEWVPNDHYTLVRNDNYWGEMPIATSITARVIPEASARVIALEAGEIDIVWNVDAIECPNVEGNPDTILLSQPSSSIEYVGMNTSKEKFSDVRVRQAINMAIDQQSFIDAIIEGRGVPANSYINAMIPGYSEESKGYDYNVEEAKKLMAEAGYPNGFDCSILVNGSTRTRSAEMVQAQLAEIGINVTVDTYEWGAMLEMLSKGEHEMFILGWSNSSFDADGSTYQLFHSSNHGATGNRAWLTDEKVDQLIEEAQKEMDESKRMELYKELQFRLEELAPWVPLYYRDDNVGIRADLKGFKLHKGATHYLGNCHYEN